MTNTTAARNRAIKATLSKAFPGIKVTLLECVGMDLGRRYTDDTCQIATTELSLKFDRPRDAA